jgi:hypothetical protein
VPDQCRPRVEDSPGKAPHFLANDSTDRLARIRLPGEPMTESAKNSFRSLIAISAACAASIFACSARPDDPEATGGQAAALSSCNVAALGPCVAGGGGGGCAESCPASCRQQVATCLRSGGGPSCAERCVGTPAGPPDPCQRGQVWARIPSWSCGIPYGFGQHNEALPGEVKATCNVTCRTNAGNVYSECTEWWLNNRPDCTVGVPIDANHNPR